MSAEINRARHAAQDAIQSASDEITRVCREIFDDPEAAGAEHRTAARLTDLLARHGFSIERGVADMPTAFQAHIKRFDSEQMRKGLRHPHLAILTEYDADPDLGRVRGQHLAAGAAVATAIGLAAVLEVEPGMISVFGTPPGGKVALAETGVFESVDAALGARVAPPGGGCMYTIDNSGDTLAGVRGSAVFGDAAAASAFASALEAGRSQLQAEEYERVVIEPAGDSRIDIEISARRVERVREIRDWVAGLAGTSISFAPEIADMLVSRVVIRRVKTYGDNIGLRMDEILKTPPAPPSDWGNVSFITPSAECHFSITTDAVEFGTREFAEVSNSDAAYGQMFLLAKSMAFTGIDLLADMMMRSVADNQLVKALAARGITRPYRRWTGVHPVLPKTEPNGSGTAPVEGTKPLASSDG